MANIAGEMDVVIVWCRGLYLFSCKQHNNTNTIWQFYTITTIDLICDHEPDVVSDHRHFAAIIIVLGSSSC